jgi:hypothetical protein
VLGKLAPDGIRLGNLDEAASKLHGACGSNVSGVRYDRTQLTLRPLLTLACVLINLRRLMQQEL